MLFEELSDLFRERLNTIKISYKIFIDGIFYLSITELFISILLEKFYDLLFVVDGEHRENKNYTVYGVCLFALLLITRRICIALSLGIFLVSCERLESQEQWPITESLLLMIQLSQE